MSASDHSAGATATVRTTWGREPATAGAASSSGTKAKPRRARSSCRSSYAISERRPCGSTTAPMCSRARRNVPTQSATAAPRRGTPSHVATPATRPSVTTRPETVDCTRCTRGSASRAYFARRCASQRVAAPRAATSASRLPGGAATAAGSSSRAQTVSRLVVTRMTTAPSAAARQAASHPVTPPPTIKTPPEALTVWPRVARSSAQDAAGEQRRAAAARPQQHVLARPRALVDEHAAAGAQRRDDVVGVEGRPEVDGEVGLEEAELVIDAAPRLVAEEDVGLVVRRVDAHQRLRLV